MKRALLFLSVVILLTNPLFSQKVDSIKVEQAGDFIKVHYKIVNSTIYQVYNIKVLCSMNGGMKTELRSMTGDIGDGVLGGKEEYVVLWDVFKDVDELRSIEFFVRAELTKDNTKVNLPVNEKLLTRKVYLLAATSIDGHFGLYGARFAYMSSWGISSKFLIGEKATFSSSGRFKSLSAGIDLTKRIIKNPEYQLHLIAGFTTIKLQPSAVSEDPKFFLTWDVGLIFARKRILFSAALSSVKNSKVAYQNDFPEIGLGIKF